MIKTGKNNAIVFGNFAPPKIVIAPIGVKFGAWGNNRASTPTNTNTIGKTLGFLIIRLL